jgi:hypothetical protein
LNSSKIIESLQSTAEIPQGFKYFYLTIIGITGTLLAVIILLMTTALFQIIYKVSKSFFVLFVLSIIGYIGMLVATGDVMWFDHYLYTEDMSQ